MACSSSARARVVATSLVVGLAGLTACGHFGIELLPASEDGTDGGADGSGDDASISADGGADGPIDAGRDSGVCEGPNCPGTYVAGDVGDDILNNGTSDKPFKTIAKGIEVAKMLGVPTNVYIAAKANAGKYGDKLTIVEGVSLIGGYDCKVAPCSWARDIPNNPTLIAATDYRGLVVGDTITRATALDGLHILGTGPTPDVAPGAVALTIDGGAPTVRRCRIDGPAVSGGTSQMRRSIGIAILGPPPAKEPLGPLLQANTVRSGTSVEDSFAILIAQRQGAAAGASAAATIIDDNNIRSGQGLSSVGIVGWQTSATTLIEGNAISSGTSTGGTFGSWAIEVGGGMTIHRNRINLEASPVGTSGPICTSTGVFCGGIHSSSSAAVITSNIIRGAKGPRAAAVLLGAIEGVPGLVVLNGNTLDPVGDASDNSSVSTAIVLKNTIGVNATVGRVRNNILLGGTNQFRYGVYEDNTGKIVHLLALDNNDFFNPGAAQVGDYAYRFWDGASAKNYLFTELASIGTPVPTGNLDKDPLLDGAFHLKPGSPMIDQGTNKDGDAPAHDLDDEGRPKGGAIDIGADEKQ